MERKDPLSELNGITSISFSQDQSQGRCATLVHDGNVIVESTVIVHHLGF
ncbi:MAG: hypothetical protein ACM3SP_12105 [Chloroflexota bacterium]